MSISIYTLDDTNDSTVITIQQVGPLLIGLLVVQPAKATYCIKVWVTYDAQFYSVY